MLVSAFHLPLTPAKNSFLSCKTSRPAFSAAFVQRATVSKRCRRPSRQSLSSRSIRANEDSPFSEENLQFFWDNSPFRPNDVVSGKYTIKNVLGRGSNGITFEAALSGKSSSSIVALKALSFKAMNNWKALDLFQREARTLRSLSHPAIPDYIDSFEVDQEGDRIFVLVQRKAPGVSLQHLLDSGYRFTTEQVKTVFRKLLEVLQYLASLNPPVLHRDVKPSNVILDLGKFKEPQVSLVDFGGVNTGTAGGTFSGSLGSTMVGTFGYMAPEQFSGAADVRSDLYAAAATVLYMLTGRPPSSIPQNRLKIDVESVVPQRERKKLGAVYTVMSKLLEPAPEDRYDTAEESLDALLSRRSHPISREASVSNSATGESTTRGGGSLLSSEEALSLQQALANIHSATSGSSTRPLEMFTEWAGRQIRRRKPSGSRVVLERDRANRLLQVAVPPKGFSGDSLSKGAFAMAWTGFTAFWTVGVLTGGAPAVFSLFSIPFWAAGLRMAKSTAEDVAGVTNFVASFGSGEKEVFYFALSSKSAFGQERFMEGDARDLSQATIETKMYVNGQPITELVLEEGTRRHAFGRSLDEVEKEWLRDEINDFILCRNRR